MRGNLLDYMQFSHTVLIPSVIFKSLVIPLSLSFVFDKIADLNSQKMYAILLFISRKMQKMLQILGRSHISRVSEYKVISTSVDSVCTSVSLFKRCWNTVIKLSKLSPSVRDFTGILCGKHYMQDT